MFKSRNRSDYPKVNPIADEQTEYVNQLLRDKYTPPYKAGYFFVTNSSIEDKEDAIAAAEEWNRDYNRELVAEPFFPDGDDSTATYWRHATKWAIYAKQ